MSERNRRGWTFTMLSILRRSWLFAFLGLAALSLSARAQEVIEFDGIGDYDTDYQFFEPWEVDDYGGYPPPNTGWFGHYDRVYLNGTRPRFEPSHTQGDFGWGNQIEIGYMTEGGHGWMASALTMGGGVDVVNATYKPQLAFDPTATYANPYTQNADGTFDQANVAYDPRINQDLVINSLNSFRFSSFELNRVWRLAPGHHGGIIEPFAGFRYADMDDHTRRMDQFQVSAAGFEQLSDQQSYWENSMWGGQVGVRLARQTGRLLVGTEIRVMGFANFQHFEQSNYFLTRIYTNPLPADPTQEFLEYTNTYGSNEEFVIGGDVRVNAAYDITRDIAIHGGLQWMGFGKGIARGNALQNNTGDFYLFGLTFGVSLNR
jgi:hypothetical protein